MRHPTHTLVQTDHLVLVLSLGGDSAPQELCRDRIKYPGARCRFSRLAARSGRQLRLSPRASRRER